MGIVVTFVRSTNPNTPLMAALGGFAKVALILNMVVKKNEIWTNSKG